MIQKILYNQILNLIVFVNLERGDYFFKSKKVDFIKIDVEGYELDVMKRY